MEDFDTKKARNKRYRQLKRGKNAGKIKTGVAVGGARPNIDKGGGYVKGSKILIKGKEPIKFGKFDKHGTVRGAEAYVFPTEKEMFSGTKKDAIKKYGKKGGRKLVRAAKEDDRVDKSFTLERGVTTAQRRRLRKKMK